MTKPSSPEEADVRLVQFDTDGVEFKWLEDGVVITPPAVDHFALVQHYDIPGYIIELPLTIVDDKLLMKPEPASFAVAGYYMLEIERVDGPERSTAPTYNTLSVYVRDDISNAPTQDSMDGADVFITETTVDLYGDPLGEVPKGSVVSAFRDGQPEVSKNSVDGTFTLGVVSGSLYTIYVHFPGYPLAPRVVQT